MTKAYVYIKHKSIVSKTEGMQKYDVAYVYPMVADQGKLTLDTYLPVVMDLTIPCSVGLVSGMDWNVDVSGSMWSCSQCPYNDYLQCDVVNLTRAKWSAGDIDNPPVMLQKRIHRLDYTKFLNGTQVTSIEKEGKTEQEKTFVFNTIKNREQTKTILEVKI